MLTLQHTDLSPVLPVRKPLLAEQLVQEPNLLTLDEPTIHLDVGSIKALQRMIVDFPGVVLLITHNRQLADAVTRTAWHTEERDGIAQLCVR